MENFDLMLFFKALGLAVAIEGALWGGFPEMMKRAAAAAGQTPAGVLRAIGLVMFAVGLLVCWLGF